MNAVLLPIVCGAILGACYYYTRSFLILLLICGASLTAWYYLAANFSLLLFLCSVIAISWQLLPTGFFLLFLACSSILMAWYFWREHKLNTPSLQWPYMSTLLGLGYDVEPPRMAGVWNRREIAIETCANGVTFTAVLNAETRLRAECGPTSVVAGRAGVLVPDAVEPIDADFGDKLLARCSDKAAGRVIFDITMQQLLAGLNTVDLIGEQSRVIWTVPVLRDIDETEALLGALCAVADGLERFPRNGGQSGAQTKRP